MKKNINKRIDIDNILEETYRLESEFWKEYYEVETILKKSIKILSEEEQ